MATKSDETAGEDQADEKAAPAQSYRVVRGINYPGGKTGAEKRANVGDVVNDLPEGSIDWLLADGAIEKA